MTVYVVVVDDGCKTSRGDNSDQTTSFFSLPKPKKPSHKKTSLFSFSLVLANSLS